MEAPTARGEAVLGAVAFSSERLLRGEGDIASRLQEVLAHLGAAAGADRAYLFQNVRDPQGRLWMDLRAEWDAPGICQIFEDPDNHLHPYAPAFTRLIDLFWRGEVLAELVRESMPESERDGARARRRAFDPVGARCSCATSGGDTSGSTTAPTSASGPTSRSTPCAAVAGDLGVLFDRELIERTQELEADRYRSMIEHGPAVSYIDATDENASTIFISPQIEALLGLLTRRSGSTTPTSGRPCCTPTTVPERSPRTSGTTRPASRSAWSTACSTGTATSCGCTTRRRWCATNAAFPSFSHGVMMDVSDRKRGEENVAFLAYHDELTGLPSRSMFDELLELSHLSGATPRRCGRRDRGRHRRLPAGQRLARPRRAATTILKVVADRLREASRETDLVARRGGDQFLLLIADLERDAGGEIDTAVVRAEAAAQRVRDAMTRAHHDRRHRALRLGEHGDQPVPAGR